MSNVIIRKAQLGDAEILAELSRQLGYPSTVAEVLERLEAILSQLDHHVLIAEIHGQVVGWVHIFTAYRVESSPFAEIGGLVVDQNFRGKGIGLELVIQSKQWASDQGLGQIRVRSNVMREAAHRFYQRIGFEQSKTSIVFSMQI
ncbi:GNAT family N-acetyltransferase [Aquirhabdus parva]|uniref:GNAT family N-acetyltransferase n=1 Tax=Aquirhabdus parva TaxID=2283318 RepID=A0A345P5C3_9GAMM|nr:GNAT family N-acetyltransferase [Aquirhabdus parva]AXI02482.1 GNAT family N-acetyltransferase [Aquirhabdus parva]